MQPLEKVMYELMQDFIEFPYGKICKHLVVCNMLNALEKHGLEISEPLVTAVVDCDDEAALGIFKGMLKEQ